MQGVWVVGFWVAGFKFRVPGLGPGFMGLGFFGLRLRLLSAGFRAQGSGIGDLSSGGLVFKVERSLNLERP